MIVFVLQKKNYFLKNCLQKIHTDLESAIKWSGNNIILQQLSDAHHVYFNNDEKQTTKSKGKLIMTIQNQFILLR